MEAIPEIIAAFGAFGFIFVLPLVWMFMRHQRAMAQAIHGGIGPEALRRIEMLEREVHELRVRQHDQIIRADSAGNKPSAQ